MNNNAYTNVMTVYVLRTALKAIAALARPRRGELLETLGLIEPELMRWKEIITKMRVVFHGDGIISQFEGYEQLLEFDWQRYREKYGTIQRLDRILEAEGTGEADIKTLHKQPRNCSLTELECMALGKGGHFCASLACDVPPSTAPTPGPLYHGLPPVPVNGAGQDPFNFVEVTYGR